MHDEGRFTPPSGSALVPFSGGGAPGKGRPVTSRIAATMWRQPCCTASCIRETETAEMRPAIAR